MPAQFGPRRGSQELADGGVGSVVGPGAVAVVRGRGLSESCG
ncbi:hypothetical protein ACFW88_03735 [Streptomyces anandii]|uniref:Uncharacterized protein n=1 Tax=Streptomyces anandii TaxID=285454 RepID=A0ABW6GZT6_9ACTN